ncbi:hypothetical protein [Pseudonocardia abyssalis]|uniref:hypothetical protein n=1 Tax=Pseudonocardia abyssalis TaxID=2792008 RepID=UPI001C49FD1C|nr:hypothetical protein [Pseudonocardia abyssalis]
MSRPAGYRIRIDGHFGDRWSAWFDGLALVRDPDGTTTLTGDVPDQAALHGLLAKVRDLGVILMSVEVVPPVCPRNRTAVAGVDRMPDRPGERGPEG